MNNFYKDLKNYFKQAEGYENIIKAYERGLITLDEAIKLLRQAKPND